MKGMTRGSAAASPDAYVASLQGWQHDGVRALRGAIVGAAPVLQERIKWGHLVYLLDGPVLLVRAEEERLLFGFWHGQRLRDIEPRLKPGGKYEMATLVLVEGTPLSETTVAQLVAQAVALNQSLGDPTKLSR
jgi:hypothetical protein